MSKVNDQVLPVVRARVRGILSKTPSFRALPKPYQQRLAQDMVKVAAYIAGGKGGAVIPTSAVFTRQKARIPSKHILALPGKTRVLSLVNEVDFPGFVADLIDGVFNAIVDASVKQMQAYAELMKSVAQTVDKFLEDNISGDTARDYLADQSSDCIGDDTDAQPLGPAARRLALNRQQVLATQVLMGINRIVVTKGSIKAGVSFDAK